MRAEQAFTAVARAPRIRRGVRVLNAAPFSRDAPVLIPSDPALRFLLVSPKNVIDYIFDARSLVQIVVQGACERHCPTGASRSREGLAGCAPPKARRSPGSREQAGVSVATVSRVLNGHENVRPATREKVLAAVATSGYASTNSRAICAPPKAGCCSRWCPDFGNPFYAEIVRGIDSVARQHGYFMLLCDTGADPGRERSYFDLLRRRRADGAICLDPATIQQALGEESGALPWVACCEFDPAVGVPYVGIDNYRAAGDAVRHLLARGHRRIGADQLRRRLSVRAAASARLSGRADRAGITPDPRWRMNLNSLDYEAGARRRVS